jgi:NAD-dependent deacetylase
MTSDGRSSTLSRVGDDGRVNIVVLTGAGISAESGLATFRDADGLWEGHRVEDVATPEGFAADPDLVHTFYDQRRASLDTVTPNAAHAALATLERQWAERTLGDFLLVTQNVDDLHERAGSQNLVHMHGALRTVWCLACDEHPVWSGGTRGAPCPRCGSVALRPDVVWFGEVPRGLETIDQALHGVDLFVSIGTSGAVYPAAGFVQHAAARRAGTLELNLVPSEGSLLFRESRHGPATELVPAWVREILEC